MEPTDGTETSIFERGKRSPLTEGLREAQKHLQVALRIAEGVEKELPREVVDLFNSLYGDIWIEACYDPTSDGSAALAQKLLPKISRLNELLGFKG